VDGPTYCPKPAATQAADSQHVDHVVAQIQDELRLLALEHTTIKTRLRIIKYTLIGLTNLFGSDIINEKLRAMIFRRPMLRTAPDQPGFTDACRHILRSNTHSLTVPQLRKQMQERYPSVLARQRVPTASLSVVLRRLQRYGEVEVVNRGGKQAWQWAAHPQQGNTGDASLSSPTTLDKPIMKDAATNGKSQL
jgi:hypothetical protein